MDTINVTRANQGEHWLVGRDLTTIKASGRDTRPATCSSWMLPSRQAAAPRSFIGTCMRRLFASCRASLRLARWTRTTR